MTKKELSQLYYLNREIEHQQRKLQEFESLATACTASLTGMPRGSTHSDKVANYSIEIADLKSLVDLNIKKCYYELSRLNRFIETIEDSQIRLIISLRYINCLNWAQIAYSIGGGNTADGVRMTHNRFLSKK